MALSAAFPARMAEMNSRAYSLTGERPKYVEALRRKFWRGDSGQSRSRMYARCAALFFGPVARCLNE